LKEEWKQIKDFPMYDVSNFGRVRTKFIKRSANLNYPYMKLKMTIWGYLQVGLRKESNGKKYQKAVHRLVLLAFKPQPINKDCCNHIDGNKTNNHISNLEWVNRKENTIHAFDIGIQKSGEKSRLAKLSKTEVWRIKKLIKNKVCQRRIAEHFKVTETTISDIKYNRSWKRSHENRNS
jgi:hypothetical protein